MLVPSSTTFPGALTGDRLEAGDLNQQLYGMLVLQVAALTAMSQCHTPQISKFSLSLGE